MLKEMFKEETLLSSFILLVLLIGSFIAIDVIYSTSKIFNAVVIDKQYKAEVNSSGTGYGIASSGQLALVVTSEHESEKFILFVKKSNGQITSVECKPELYYLKKIGDKIKCDDKRGYFTKTTYSVYGIE